MAILMLKCKVVNSCISSFRVRIASGPERSGSGTDPAPERFETQVFRSRNGTLNKHHVPVPGRVGSNTERPDPGTELKQIRFDCEPRYMTTMHTVRYLYKQCFVKLL